MQQNRIGYSPVCDGKRVVVKREGAVGKEGENK